MSFIQFKSSERFTEISDSEKNIMAQAKSLLASAPELSDQSKEWVMTIDDDKDQHEVLKSMLGDDFSLLCCFDIEDAISVYQTQQEKVKSIILDIRLGRTTEGVELSGYQLFMELKKINPSIPIIFRTGFQEEFKHELDIYKTYRPHGYVVKNSPEEHRIVNDTVSSAVAAYNYILEDLNNQKLKLIFLGIRGWIHDFGNLFMTVQSREYMIANHEDRFEKLQIVKMIQENLMFMELLNGMQSTITDYARNEDVRTLLTSFDSAVLFSDFIELLKIAFPRMMLHYQCDYFGEFVTNKTVMFSQILINIAKNAYQAGGKNLTFLVMPLSHYLEKYSDRAFKISDPDALVGIVIDDAGGVPENIEHTFFEVDFSFNKDGGTGLGTWLIRRGVEDRLQGELFYINHVGKGLEYRFCLPRLTK